MTKILHYLYCRLLCCFFRSGSTVSLDAFKENLTTHLDRRRRSRSKSMLAASSEDEEEDEDLLQTADYTL